jgi:hypothetical protein
MGIWAVGAFIVVYLLFFAAIVFSDGRVSRAVVGGGRSSPLFGFPLRLAY